MTAADLAKLIGRTGTARVSASNAGNSFQVDVRITNAKTAFGRTDVLVAPVAGSGQVWMSLDNITLTKDA